MTNAELKPCPFCGGEAAFRNSIVGFYAVECIKCRAIVSFAGKEGKGSCASAWNRRVAE